MATIGCKFPAVKENTDTIPETVRQDTTVHTGFVSRNGVAMALEGICSQGEVYKNGTYGNHRYW